MLRQSRLTSGGTARRRLVRRQPSGRPCGAKAQGSALGMPKEAGGPPRAKNCRRRRLLAEVSHRKFLIAARADAV